jgi:hypothetical protein
MKKLVSFVLFALMFSVASAQVTFAPFMLYSDDYTYTSNTAANASGGLYPYDPHYAIYPNSIITSLTTQTVSTQFAQSVWSSMPPDLKTLTWGFTVNNPASTTCPMPIFEPNIPAAVAAAVNIPSFIANGKTYFVSAGGAGHTFKCNSGTSPNNTAFMTYVNTFVSPNLLGFDFDIEGQTIVNSSYTGTICNSDCTGVGNILTVTADTTPVSLGQEIYNNGLAVGVYYIIAMSGSQLNGVTACGSCTGTGGTGTYLVGKVNNVAASLNITSGVFGTSTPNYSQNDVFNLIEEMNYAQTTYPGLQWSFQVGGNACSVGCSTGFSQYAVWIQEAMAVYPVTNYVFVLQAGDFLQQSNQCVISAGVCEMGLSVIQEMQNAHNYNGIPYANLGVNPYIGGNDWVGGTIDFLTIADVATITTWFTANGLNRITPWAYSRDFDCATQASPNTSSDTCNNYGSVGTAGTLGFTKAFLSGLGQ